MSGRALRERKEVKYTGVIGGTGTPAWFKVRQCGDG